MKKIFTLLLTVLFTISGFAQAPQKISYQAVLRDGGGTIVQNHAVGIRIQILQTSESGTAVYVETHSTTTNANGLVTLEIGNGIVVSGTFAGIDWTAGPYFIKTEIDPVGGTSYSITGTTQLLSVPYALYSNIAGSSASNPQHYIGESYGGGKVFFVYDNGRHGLIASTSDQNGGAAIRWYAGTYANTMALADGFGAGKANTAIIIASQGFGDGSTYAARICNEYSATVDGVTYGDWYLPSIYELNLLYLQKAVVGGFANTTYWSSTESDINSATLKNFYNGFQGGISKDNPVHVRAVRAF